VARRDYFDEPGAPKANSIVPAATAIVPDDENRVLLIRRSDNGRWALPGGQMEVGEYIADSVVREVEEETGLLVEVVRILGIYTDPRHIIAYDDGEVRQQFAVCFQTRIVGGALMADGSEAKDARFVAADELHNLNIHPSTLLRVRHFFENRTAAYIG
jgi:8-oxo-dGTP pyrophosphatase MutT (NUDIX family)